MFYYSTQPDKNSRTNVINLRCAHKSQLVTRCRNKINNRANVGTTADALTV